MPSMKKPNGAMLGALSAIGQIVAIAALLALLLWASWPGDNTAEMPMFLLTCMIGGVVAVLLIATNIAFAKQMLAEARRER